MEIVRRKGVKGVRIVGHNRKLLWIIISLIAVLVLVLLYITLNNKDNSEINGGLANPASVYCANNNGTLEIRTSADGSQYGICILENGVECDEWAYYRGECGNVCGGIAGLICPKGYDCDMQGKTYPDASGICTPSTGEK